MTVSQRIVLAFALPFAAATSALAQAPTSASDNSAPQTTTTTTTAAVPPAPAPNQVVQMSDFEVSDRSSSNGYIASETMTGPRIGTKIIDLPYSVVNLTSEFFNDFGV